MTTATEPTVLVDCFPFFNELDVLEIRLHELDPIVDRFVLAEATKDHAGRDKPLHFAQNRERFAPFLNKITHIVVDDYPEFEDKWTFENHQRNCLVRGLAGCSPRDRILISDCDEIPDSCVLASLQDKQGVFALNQLFFCYSLNNLCVSDPVWYGGTRLCNYAFFMHGLDHLHFDMPYVKNAVNPGTTPTKIRLYHDVKRVPFAGWHFSRIGDAKAVRERMEVAADEPQLLDTDTIARKIRQGEDAFGQPRRFEPVPIDEHFPRYLRENREKFAALIAPLQQKGSVQE